MPGSLDNHPNNLEVEAAHYEADDLDFKGQTNIYRHTGNPFDKGQRRIEFFEDREYFRGRSRWMYEHVNRTNGFQNGYSEQQCFGGEALFVARQIDQLGRTALSSPNDETMPDDIREYMIALTQQRREHKANRLTRLLDGARAQAGSLAQNTGLSNLIDQYPLSDDLMLPLTGQGKHSVLSGLSEANDDLLLAFMKWNQNYIRQQAAEASTELWQYRDEFKNTLFYAIHHQNFPLSAEVLLERLDMLYDIKYGDPLVAAIMHAGGYYVPESGLPIIACGEDPSVRRYVVFHELLHHISGQTFITDEDDDHPQEVKAGLATSGRLRWLDEALTEQLTLLLLHPRAREIDYATLTRQDIFRPEFRGGVYWNQRVLFSHLMAGLGVMMEEVPFETFIKAYFEEFNPNASARERAPASKALYVALGEAWGGFKNIRDIVYKKAVRDPVQACQTLADMRKQRLKILEAIFVDKNFF